MANHFILLLIITIIFGILKYTQIISVNSRII